LDPLKQNLYLGGFHFLQNHQRQGGTCICVWISTKSEQN
jgi:hypothetical protein